MKKIIIFSIILAVAAGIAASLLFALTPSDYILDYAVYNDDTLYTLSSYSHGIYLKKSDNQGIISSHRLKYRNGRYMGLLAENDRVYTLVIDGADIVVDEYDADGGYLKEMLRVAGSKLGVYGCNLEQYFISSENESSKLFTDIIMLADGDVFVYPIFKDTVQQMIHYDINCEEGIIWAQRGYDGLFYMTRQGELFLLANDGRTHLIELDEGYVPYDPQVSYFSLFLTDVGSVSLKHIIVSPNEDGVMEALSLQESIITADSEIYDGVTFSQLRNVRVGMDDNYSYNVTGIKENGADTRKIYLFNPYSAKNTEFPEAGFEIYKCILVFFICAAAVFAAALVICFLIRRLLAVRKVIIKQIMLVAAIIVSVSVMIHFFLLNSMNNLVFSQAAAQLEDTLDYIELSIDSDQFRDSGLSEQQREIFRNYEYRSTSKISNNSDFINRFIETDFHISFVEIARLTDDGYKYEFYSNQLPGARVSYFVTDEDRFERITNMEDGVDIIGNSTELGTQWLESVRAITDSSGKQVGFIQIGSEKDSLNDHIHNYVDLMTLFIMLFIVEISVLFIVIMAGLLRPLKKLKRAVSEVAEGKIGTTVSVSSNDELQDVAASFSNMSRQLEKYFNNINVISKAYEKYLPKGFFRLMGKSSVLDVKPGDHNNAELTYLFIGINLPSEHLSDEEGFCALNGIYGIVSEVLGSTGGTIQSFSDKMITCIFSGSAAEAAESALTIQEKLGSHADIDASINVSIQNSRSVIGVIGSGEAMKTVTVSPAIELQYCLRNIMSRFGLTFVITEEVLSELKAARLNITARRIGTVNELMGGQTRFDIMLYEVIDGCPDEEKKLRQAALGSYERAVEALDESDAAEARAQLISVLRVNRDDLIARHLLSRISGESEVNNDERSKDRLEIPD